jgi:tRNA (guanine37-N1)-methyltransferase
MFPGFLQYSLAGKALNDKLWSYDVINIRDFGVTKHKNVDDEPYGGGHGLVMRPDVVGRAIDCALKTSPTAKLYYMSPRGIRFNQSVAKRIVSEERIIILCGRFEGIDERIIEEYNATEISLGDFVLSGGEVAALAMLDACIRLVPGVLANHLTLSEESFSEDYCVDHSLLEYPLYTRPSLWRGRMVPEVLTSGNHSLINKWRFDRAMEVTKNRRPDLVKKVGKSHEHN